jgi:hypothetical protein
VLERIACVAMATVLLVGCGSTRGAGSAQPSPSSAAETSSDAGDAQPGNGRMVVSYDDATTPEAKAGKKLLQDHHVLEDLAAAANELLVLPYDIPLRGVQCDEPNAFWSPADQTMLICYEESDLSLQIFTKAGDADPVTSAVNTTVATFFHEMGHMTINIYDLPATGREEDVADQLSAFLLMQPDENGKLDPENVQAVIDSAREFDAYGKLRGELDEDAFADSHSIDQARKYNLLCWVYGADPEGRADLVSSKQLPEGRAGNCESEWDRLSHAWSTLLEPHLKS